MSRAPSQDLWTVLVKVLSIQMGFFFFFFNKKKHFLLCSCCEENAEDEELSLCSSYSAGEGENIWVVAQVDCL